MGHRLEPKSQALPSFKLTLREFPRVSNSHWLPSPITAIMASAGFFGIIFWKVTYLLLQHICYILIFFMQKWREKILCRQLISTHFKSNKFCISVLLTLQKIPLEMDLQPINHLIADCRSINQLNNFYIIQSLEIQAIIF